MVDNDGQGPRRRRFVFERPADVMTAELLSAPEMLEPPSSGKRHVAPVAHRSIDTSRVLNTSREDVERHKGMRHLQPKGEFTVGFGVMGRTQRKEDRGLRADYAKYHHTDPFRDETGMAEEDSHNPSTTE